MRSRFDRVVADARMTIVALDAQDARTYTIALNRVALAVGRMLGYLEALLDGGSGGDEELERVLDVVAAFEQASAAASLT